MKIENAAPNTLTQSEIEDGWVLLFDGKSADNWRGYNNESFPEKGWKVDEAPSW